MHTYDFLTRAEYFKSLAAAAAKAKTGERVIVATMALNPNEPLVATLLQTLEQAAGRGVHVTLILDAINFLIQETGVPRPARYNQRRKRSRSLWEALQQLQRSGGSFFITNVPTKRYTLPQAGRSHIKGAVIGDDIFVGGCNLDRVEDIDVMVHWHDKTAADVLANWLVRMTEAERVRDAFEDVDSEAAADVTTKFLLDAGVPRQSLIYDEALQLIDEAEAWLFITCQYFPGGETARRLEAAHKRGVDVTIQFSHPRSHGTGASLQYVHQLRERNRGLPAHFFTGRLGKLVPRLHAKILASEKAAMVGSHNYVIQGVTFGTAELALYSTDPTFALAVRQFAEREIAAAQQVVSK